MKFQKLLKHNNCGNFEHMYGTMDGSAKNYGRIGSGEVYRLAHFFYFRAKSFIVWRIKSYMVL